MATYIGTYLMLAIASLTNGARKNRQYLFIIFAFLSWFMGLRYFVGCDYYGYGIRFREAEYSNLVAALQGQEFGFELLTFVGAKYLGDYNLFLLLASSIVAFLYLRFAGKYRDAALVLALFFPVLIVQLGMSGLRQAIAVGFVALAYNAFVDVRRVRCAVLVLIAGLFHTSAFIFLPLSLIAGKNFSLFRIGVSIALLSVPAAFLLGSRLDVYQDRYIEQIYGAQESGGAWVRYVLTLLPVPAFLSNLKFFQRTYEKQYNLFIIGAFMILAAALLGFVSSVALHRILFYLMPLSILLAVGTLDLFQNRLRGRIFWVGIYFVYMVAWFLTSRHADICYTPYQNITFLNVFAPE